MIRIACFAFMTFSLISPIGCALCCSPFDPEFVTYGGKTPRVDMRHGRVGSNFSDPQLVGYAADSSAPNRPMEIEAIESEYGTLLESSSDSDLDSNPDTNRGQRFIETDEPMLLEQRQPTAFKPRGNSRIIQVPSGENFRDSSGDSFFDDVP